MKVEELRMLRWTWCCVIRLDRIRDEYIENKFKSNGHDKKTRERIDNK